MAETMLIKTTRQEIAEPKSEVKNVGLGQLLVLCAAYAVMVTAHSTAMKWTGLLCV